MNSRGQLDQIVVIGGGITALCAAIGFARALPRTRVTVIATPTHPAALTDRLPALDPRGLALLARFGIGEQALVAAGAATHRVGQRFAWGGDPFVVEEGDGMPLLAGAALHQLWRAHGDGPLHALVPGAALAAAERFVHPVDDGASLLSHYDYAVRLDAARAAGLLARVARAAGVEIAGATQAVAAEGAVIADGTGIAADLVIDAGGPDASHSGAESGWVNWSASLPADRLLLADAPASPSPTDTYEAVGDGWAARWPLATRTITGFAYASAITTDARARRLFSPDAERVVVRAGRRTAPFSGSVLTLGDAAATTGAFGWLGLPLALAQLEIALDLMPARGDGPALANEYNRRAGLMAERMHSYAAAFHLAGPPRKGPFWHALRRRAVPPDLATALDQFGRRGTLPPEEEAMIARGTWQQALTGLGVRPARIDPVALSVPRTSAVAALTQLRRAIAALPATLPPYPHYLGSMMREGTR